MIEVKQNIEIKKPKRLIEDETVIKEIVKDYKQHLSEIDEILDFIVFNRFTNERRYSFLHLKANEGFGKSFIKSLLKELSLTELHYREFSKICPIPSKNFENSIGIIVDEFTVFKKEFKAMTNEIISESKFEERARVQAFAKIFLSIKDNTIDTQEQDAQIIDRVRIIDKDNDKLHDREVYKKYGNKTYYNAVLNYSYNYLINKIEKEQNSSINKC